LSVVATVGALGVIIALSWKKIVPYMLKKTLAGYMSGFARNQKAVKKEIVKLMMDKTLVGPALDMLGFGGIKQYLIRHPDASFTVMQMLSPFLEKLLDGQKIGEFQLPQGLGGNIAPELETLDYTASPVKERLKALVERFGTQDVE